jgi:hypothetical protein
VADSPKPLDHNDSDSRGWAGEPDLAAVYALGVCLIIGAAIFLLGAVARI